MLFFSSRRPTPRWTSVSQVAPTLETKMPWTSRTSSSRGVRSWIRHISRKRIINNMRLGSLRDQSSHGIHSTNEERCSGRECRSSTRGNKKAENPLNLTTDEEALEDLRTTTSRLTSTWVTKITNRISTKATSTVLLIWLRQCTSSRRMKTWHRRTITFTKRE